MLWQHGYISSKKVSLLFLPKADCKLRRICNVLTLLVFSSLSYTVNAASTSTNASYNGVWAGVTSGTPSSNQNNTFNHTGGSAALTITGGVAAYLDDSTNTINGNLVINGDGSGNATGYFDNSINTITGDITIGDGCVGSFSRSSNTISGGINVSGSANFGAFGPSNSTNTIMGGVTVGDNSSADFSNAGSGTVTNAITGGIIINGNGTADFSNTSSGFATNTIDTATLNGTCTLSLGGEGSTTHIDTLNWNSGTLQFVCANCSFGNTTIDTLNLGSGPLIISLYNSDVDSELQFSEISGTQTLFTVGTITGDPSNIHLVNTSPFTEVVANGTSNGVTVSPDGKVTITVVPTATAAGQSNAIEALNAAGDILQGLQTSLTNSENAFAPTRYQQAKMNANIARIMKENSKDSHEALITALAKENSGSVVKIRGDWRVFATPFATEIRNKGLGGYMAGFKEKYYGMLMGGSHYFKKSGINLLAVIGFGASKTQQDRSINSYSNGKNVMLGLDLRKTFTDHWKIGWDFESNLSGIVVKNTQQREGNPTPTQSYIAYSRFNTYSVAFKNELGPIFKLPNGYSVKPDVGLQVNGSKRTKIQEQNAGIYAQNYRGAIARDGEVYGGVGVRKQWKGEIYEGKITLKYEVGQKSGNGKSSTTIYTNTIPAGVSSTSTNPGRFTQYINLYGSMLNMKSNWKCVPGITLTLQKGQRSVSGTLKFEHRF